MKKNIFLALIIILVIVVSFLAGVFSCGLFLKIVINP